MEAHIVGNLFPLEVSIEPCSCLLWCKTSRRTHASATAGGRFNFVSFYCSLIALLWQPRLPRGAAPADAWPLVVVLLAFDFRNAAARILKQSGERLSRSEGGRWWGENGSDKPTGTPPFHS
jgi:hypothetical protein